MKMSNKKAILIRADSSSIIGTGHIYRCMTLAKPLQKKYKVIFCTQSLDGNINHKIIENGFEIIDIIKNTPKEMIQIIKQYNPKITILDGYNFGYKYEKKIHKATKLFCFDDIFAKHHCDIVLNHSIEAKSKQYKNLVQKNTRVLAGSKYTLLRDEFFDIPLKKRDTLHLDNAKVLVMFGGSDPKNFTLSTIKTLDKIDKNFDITIITTSSNKNLDTIKEYIKDKISYNLVINTNEVSKYINDVDFAITTSGGTILEIIFMKVPFINIKMVDNQSNIVKYFKKKKIATCLDDFDENELTSAVSNLETNYKTILKLLHKIKFYKYKASNVINKI